MNKRRVLSVLFLLFLATILEGCGLPFLSDLYPETDEYEISTESSMASESQTEAMTNHPMIYIHVCGFVKEPGLYVLEEGARIDAAIRAAGGFAQNADEKSVNLAEILVDGSQIEVLSLEDRQSSQSSGQEKEQKININLADKTQLMSLNGIGEGKALAILSYRENKGKFASVEDIKQVDGIGDGIYQKIKDTITVK